MPIKVTFHISLVQSCDESVVLLGQGLKHGDDSLADVRVEVPELRRHVGQRGEAIRVQVLVLKEGSRFIADKRRDFLRLPSF